MSRGLDARVIEECSRLSFEDKITFPEVVKRLAAIGVERYLVDLVCLEKTSYGRSGQTHREALPLASPGTIGATFSEAGVQQALAAIRRKETDYPRFLRDIMAAGVASYAVFIAGKRAMYLGNQGDFYVERFPAGL